MTIERRYSLLKHSHHDDLSVGPNDELRFDHDGSNGSITNSTGSLVMGTNGTPPSYFGGTPGLVWYGTGNKSFAFIGRFENAQFGPSLGLGFSRNATAGAHTVLQSGDNVGDIVFLGSDGASWIPAARIIASVDGTPGTTDMPGRLTFWTTPDGSQTPVERMRITRDGEVGINGTPATGVILLVKDPAHGPALEFGWISDTAPGYVYIQGYNRSNSTYGIIRMYGNAVEFNLGASALFRGAFTDTSTAGQTALQVYDVDNAQVERVTVGAADSGGAGFKVLRIPN